MLLLGQGGPKNTEEAVMWLEGAGELGEYQTLKLLVDCYENGYYDVPADAGKAALWRSRLEDYDRLLRSLRPPNSTRRLGLRASPPFPQNDGRLVGVSVQ